MVHRSTSLEKTARGPVGGGGVEGASQVHPRKLHATRYTLRPEY